MKFIETKDGKYINPSRVESYRVSGKQTADGAPGALIIAVGDDIHEVRWPDEWISDDNDAENRFTPPIIIPAQPGWFMLEYRPADEYGPEEVERNPVIAWTPTKWGMSPLTLESEVLRGDCDVLRPDGVVATFGDGCYASVEEWVAKKREVAAPYVKPQAAAE